VPPHLRPVSRTFTDGDDCIYLSEFTRDIDIFSVPNRVIAVMQGSDGAEGLVGVASNMNPLDPFSYPSRGRWITNTYTDVDATSQAALNSWAAKTLVDAANPTDVITIKHAPVPLDIYDAVMFGYSLAYPTVHRRVIDQTTIDLDPTGLQTSNLRRVTDYDTDAAGQALGGTGVDTVYLGSGITDGAPL
jgi:hypothetical protein